MPTSTAAEPPRADAQPVQGEPAAPPLAPETQSPTDAYMARLEVHLASLAPAERLPALKSLRTFWIAEYSRWSDRVDAGTATATDLKTNAADFVCTIAAVGARRDREQRAADDAVPTNAQDGFRPEAGR